MEAVEAVEAVDARSLPEEPDTATGIRELLEISPPPESGGPSSLGAGHLILVTRELTGLSQRALAARVGTTQPALARLETGNAVPRLRTLLRIAEAAGFHLVLGLRRPDAPEPDPAQLRAQGFDLVGTLHVNAEDGLADFVVLREPGPAEGPR